MTEREFLGRSAAGGRVGIYREQADWETRIYVGRDTDIPCAIRRWWADTSTSWDVLWFNDLGHLTVSTSIAIAAALRGDVYNNYTVWRDRWALCLPGARFEPEPCRFGCGRWPRECPHAVTFGRYDVVAQEALLWPTIDGEPVAWRQIVTSDHFDFTEVRS